MLVIITKCCAYRNILFSLCVCVLFCNSQVFYIYVYNQKQKYVDWTNDKGKKRMLIQIRECPQLHLQKI